MVVAAAGSLPPTGITRSAMSAAVLMRVTPPTLWACQPCTRMPLAGFTRVPFSSRAKAPLRV